MSEQSISVPDAPPPRPGGCGEGASLSYGAQIEESGTILAESPSIVNPGLVTPMDSVDVGLHVDVDFVKVIERSVGPSVDPVAARDLLKEVGVVPVALFDEAFRSYSPRGLREFPTPSLDRRPGEDTWGFSGFC